MGCFYVFKLHLIIDDQGKLLRIKITADNVDHHDVVPDLARSLFVKSLVIKAISLSRSLSNSGSRACGTLSQGTQEHEKQTVAAVWQTIVT